MEEWGIVCIFAVSLIMNVDVCIIALNNAKNKLLHLAMSLVTNDMDYEENHEFLRTLRNEMLQYVSYKILLTKYILKIL